MEQRVVGATGLRVSEVGLGTMTWGRDTDALDAQEMLTDFLDSGGTLVDTAPGYGDGAAEEILGAALDGGLPRDHLTISTKAGVRTPRNGRAVVDASRGTLLSSLDSSLRRLHTDHVDLFIVQAPDPVTPLEETAHALELAVTSGRARYVGVSNFPAWQCATLAGMLGGRVSHGGYGGTSGRPGGAGRSGGIGGSGGRGGFDGSAGSFGSGGSIGYSVSASGLAATQHEYSLLQRGVEREVLPAAESLGFGLIAWSALGRGVLTGKYRHSTPADSRGASPHLRAFVSPLLTDASFGVVESVVRAAEGLDVQPAEVALAWLLSRGGVASVLIGPRTPSQLRVLLASELDLARPLIDALDDVSAPPVGYPERPR